MKGGGTGLEEPCPHISDKGDLCFPLALGKRLEAQETLQTVLRHGAVKVLAERTYMNGLVWVARRWSPSPSLGSRACPATVPNEQVKLGHSLAFHYDQPRFESWLRI